MMFQLHTAFAAELIALTAGIALLTWVGQGEKKCPGTTVAGYLILAAVLFSMACTLYYGVRYWEDGYFKTPSGSHATESGGMGGMGGMGMMQGKKCPMMEGMMGGKNHEGMGTETQPSEEGHAAHHPQ